MIKHEQWQGQPVVTFSNGQLTASLCPSLGGNLYRLTDEVKGREVLRVPGEPQVLIDQPGHYGTPLLMPPNRIRHGQFRYRGKDYQLEVNPQTGHHIHGFVRQRPWTLSSAREEDGQITVTQQLDTRDFPELLQQYPHALRLELDYVLSGLRLTQKLRVVNEGTEAAPFGFGLHTWFLLDSQPEEWKLKLPTAGIWELDDDTMPSGRILPLGVFEGLQEGLPLQGHNLDTVFQIGANPATAVLSKPGYTIYYRASELYKHWVIYTQGVADQFICLEPYTWVTNAPNLDLPPDVTGLTAVEPGQALDMEVELEIVHT